MIKIKRLERNCRENFGNNARPILYTMNAKNAVRKWYCRPDNEVIIQELSKKDFGLITVPSKRS